MRQVFTSQRLETVEGVAKMLEEAGIAVHVSQPRSYRGRRRGQFSYSEPVPQNQQPAVWVRLAEDQPRARELLRQAGLLATTRSYSGLPQAATEALPSRFEENGGSRWAWRIRLALLLVIAAVAVLVWMGRHKAPAPAAVPAATEQPAASQPAPAEDEDEEVRVRIAPPPPAPQD
ncbi:hypothetical protein [Pseudoxanthomonas sp. J35]|uniref:hypothetical protein n=1 Tax=Pseudoxanthomonas sp. J35 TaxID=935852 RepID=UPI00048FA0A0|nr:hypothetical protein [Pseudoxanthomonas sp. J35]